MDISKHIVKMRSKHNISQYKLAQLSGISQPTLSDIESGNNQPSFSTINKISSALGYSLSDFFIDEEPELSPELNQLLSNAKNLTPEQLAMLNQFLKSLGK